MLRFSCLEGLMRIFSFLKDSHSVYAELAPSQYSVILYGLMPYEQYNFTVSVVYSSTNQYAAHWMMGATKEGSEV